MSTANNDLRGMTDAMAAGCKAHSIRDVDQLTDALATPAVRKAWGR